MSPRAAARLRSLGFKRSYDYVGGKQDWLAHGLPRDGETASTAYAGDIVHRDAATCSPEEPAERLGALIEASPYGFCLVLDSEDVAIGRVRRSALDDAGPQATAAEVMEPGPTTIRANQPAAALGARMQERGIRTLVVTTPTGRLLGVLRRDDAVRAAE